MSRIIVVPCFNEASRLEAGAFVAAAETQCTGTAVVHRLSGTLPRELRFTTS